MVRYAHDSLPHMGSYESIIDKRNSKINGIYARYIIIRTDMHSGEYYTALWRVRRGRSKGFLGAIFGHIHGFSGIQIGSKIFMSWGLGTNPHLTALSHARYNIHKCWRVF